MSNVFVVMNAVGYSDYADHVIDSVWINREAADTRRDEIKTASDMEWKAHKLTGKPYWEGPTEVSPYIVEYDAGLLIPKEHWQPRIP